ncbi:MAG: 2,3-bisphosphoglycerate-independent phosphoglycerate mutase [candidate division WS6 bacterium GW2011_GWF2_39_15]|uniref:2,3-bisphosphoglycerate-independent phosphoglycerate mutase n=1 Tax=candidate division WS6 bacterium GW2011_GWF2_39_15 TaxID=1619100 RepID=A0A0G0MS79_9BACT|nr:MAG: 2,3-bisphosphoglycerate-independent phosphoglycerate mutase [candidate division WS6 bacterium GW2011_GWF2_39_15]
MFSWLFKNTKEGKDRGDTQKIRKDLVVLLILDGLGVHPDKLGNAVLQSKTPFLDTAWTYGRSTLLHASGTHVGLPQDEPGNSEVGHLNIGSGQVIYQSLPRINDAIANGDLDENPVIREMFDEVKKRKSDLHLFGILSAGGVHGHIEHLFHLIDLAKKEGIQPYIHAMLDGRDTGATDGYFYVSKLVQKMKETGVGRLATIMGRFYGMDRDNRWERTHRAYNALVGMGERKATDAYALLQECYKKGENDQFILPTTLVDDKGIPVGAIKDNDSVLFYNFREDRARQITKVFVQSDFNKFPKVVSPKNLFFVTMTGYADDLPTHIVFPPKKITETLSSAISNNRMNQLHISETEKFMHVTYFFNGGVEEPHTGEDFFNIPSQKVFDYATVPAMSAEIIKDEVIYRLNNLDKKKYSFIIINFANPDMLGHTGNLEATIKGNGIVDQFAKEIAFKVLEMNGALMMIADHGNCETMIDRVTKRVDTAHTNNPVPFVVLSDITELTLADPKKVIKIGTGDKATPTGILADVAPTILNILGVEPPQSMTGIDILSVV